MKTWKARVRQGRLLVDEPTALPEGTVLDLVAADEADDLDEEERAALFASLDRSWKQAQAGELRPASEILRELKQSR